ncbi:gluconokinase [Methylobacterium komagatae]
MVQTAAAIVIVMGVSGSGKTTLGLALAERHGFHFLDADDFHPPENVAKMRAGIALDDADRAPWLARLADLLKDAARRGEPTVLACSALKVSYRAILAAASPDILFVLLQGDPAILAARLGARRGHYMPPSLLASQLATLEIPMLDQATLILDCQQPVTVLCEAVMARLRPLGPGGEISPVQA